jgi:hypothetical protein
VSEPNTVEKGFKKFRSKKKENLTLKLKMSEGSSPVKQQHHKRMSFTPGQLKPIRVVRPKRRSTLLTPQQPLMHFFSDDPVKMEEFKRKKNLENLQDEEKKFGFIDFI